MTDKEEMNVQDENSIIAERRSKLAEIRSLGHAFPNNFTPEDFAKKLHALYENDEKADLEQKKYSCGGCWSNDAQARHGKGKLCYHSR